MNVETDDGTGGTGSGNIYVEKTETNRAHITRDGTGGTGRTPPGNTDDKNGGISKTNRAQITSDITPEEGVNEPSTSTKDASHASHASYEEQLTQAQEKTSTEPSQTKLPLYGISNPLQENTGLGRPANPDEVTLTSKQSLITVQGISVEWQIFGKLEDDERQSGQSIEISVPQEKFHKALESSGKLVVEDISEIIKDMNLETVCIERRKGE